MDIFLQIDGSVFWIYVYESIFKDLAYDLEVLNKKSSRKDHFVHCFTHLNPVGRVDMVCCR